MLSRCDETQNVKLELVRVEKNGFWENGLDRSQLLLTVGNDEHQPCETLTPHACHAGRGPHEGQKRLQSTCWCRGPLINIHRIQICMRGEANPEQTYHFPIAVGLPQYHFPEGPRGHIILRHDAHCLDMIPWKMESLVVGPKPCCRCQL